MRAQATPGTRFDSPDYVFMVLSATDVVFLPIAAGLAPEVDGNLPTAADARGVIATLIRFADRARERS